MTSARSCFFTARQAFEDLVGPAQPRERCEPSLAALLPRPDQRGKSELHLERCPAVAFSCQHLEE
jgi:hypothetical protein